MIMHVRVNIMACLLSFIKTWGSKLPIGRRNQLELHNPGLSLSHAEPSIKPCNLFLLSYLTSLL